MTFANTPTNGVGKHAGLLATTGLAGRTSAGYQIDWIDRVEDRGWRLTVSDGNFGFVTTIHAGPDVVEGQAQRWRFEIGVDSVTFFVNGTHVLTVADSAHQGPFYAGLWGYYENDVSFDDLLVESVDDVAPTVEILAPTPGVIYLDENEFATGSGPALIHGTTRIEVAGADTQTGIASLEIVIDGIVRAQTSESTLAYAWSTLDEMPGRHVIEARATDLAGNVANVERVVVTV